MWYSTKMTELLNIRYPIIQAGMAGSTTPELVASISNEGGLGTIGAGYMSPADLKEEIIAVQSLTDSPFAVNLFVPETIDYNDDMIQKMQQHLKPYYDKYQLDTAHVREHHNNVFHENIQLITHLEVPAVSFTFGIPEREIIHHLKSKGIITIATAGSVDEAIAIEQSDIDMVVVQAHEAGGHKGTYSGAPGIGAMALIPQCADNVSIPVIAAGGIMDARGVLAALTLGASAVQMGTAFLTSHESKAPSIHKEAIIHAKPNDTTLTKVFSGKEARGIKNKFIEAIEDSQIDIPAYPLQNDLTKNIRRSAAQSNNVDDLHLWCGQAPMLAKKINAQALFREIVSHVDNLILDMKLKKN